MLFVFVSPVVWGSSTVEETWLFPTPQHRSRRKHAVSRPGLVSHASSSLGALSRPLEASSPIVGCTGEESNVPCPNCRGMTCSSPVLRHWLEANQSITCLAGCLCSVDPKVLQNITAPGRQLVWDPTPLLPGCWGRGGCGS